MRKATSLLVMLFICGVAYAHGCRIVTLAETPSSQRPWSIIVSGGL